MLEKRVSSIPARRAASANEARWMQSQMQVRSLAWFAAFRGLWAIFIHANVRLPIGPLRMLIGAPELHHWHHSRERDAGKIASHQARWSSRIGRTMS